jgi:hypothetical protein
MAALRSAATGASGILAALIVACILFLPQNAGSHPGQEDQRAS